MITLQHTVAKYCNGTGTGGLTRNLDDSRV